MLELEDHAQLAAIGGAVESGTLGVRAPGLANRHKALFQQGLSRQLPEILVKPGTIGGDLPVRILGDLVNDIQPEARHALAHPEADYVIQLPPEHGRCPESGRFPFVLVPG